MKKIVSLLMVLVLCIACISAPAYAEDLDTPEDPIDIDEYSTSPRAGGTSIYVASGCSFSISVSGTATYDNNHPISFTLSDCSGYLSYTEGFGSGNVSYSGYYINGDFIYASVSYAVTYVDHEYNVYSPSGSVSVEL